MRIRELYGKPEWKGKPVYIVGTGPSMEVFPIKYLEDKYCILLNDASQRFFPTLRPIAFSNNKKFIENSPCPIRIVKGRLRFDPNPEKDDNHVPWDHPDLYVFSYREPPWDQVSHHDPRILWAEPEHYWNCKGGSVAIFAVQFALLAGFSEIHLVGCDCGEHVCPKPYLEDKADKKTIYRRYEQYAAGLIRLTQEAATRFNVPVISVTPYPGYGREVSQHLELKQWLESQSVPKQSN